MSAFVRTLILCLAVAFGAQATGALEVFAPCCEDDCPEDNDEGRCPPSCATCAFAKVAQSRVAPFLTGAVALVEEAGALPLVHAPAPDGVHDDVFHPPRA